jgi:hypothetical protein
MEEIDEERHQLSTKRVRDLPARALRTIDERND